MVTVGTGPDDWEVYRGLAEKYPGVVHYSAGLHPCHVAADWETALGSLESFWASGSAPQPVALGECGLDRFHLPKDAAEAETVIGWQKRAFEVQLRVAKKLGCPLIIHSRGAFRETVKMIDAIGVEQAGATLDAMNFIALAQQELGQVRTVLTGHAGDEGNLLRHRDQCRIRRQTDAVVARQAQPSSTHG